MTTNISTATTAQNSINEYLLGEVTIRDKTHGIARALISPELTAAYRQPIYAILINNKKLVYPTCSSPSAPNAPTFNLSGSTKITFKHKESFIKITEIDKTARSVWYVDLRNCHEGVAYDVYSYLPQTINLGEAAQKIQNLSEFSSFRPDIAVYNRHGVAVFGWDGRDYALYWASPSDEKLRKMETIECTRVRDGGSSYAKSKDGSVNFRFLFAQKTYYLNAELAQPLSLEKRNNTPSAAVPLTPPLVKDKSLTPPLGEGIVSQAFNQIKEIVEGPFRSYKRGKEWINGAEKIRGVWQESCPRNSKHICEGNWIRTKIGVNGRMIHLTLLQLHMGLQHADELYSTAIHDSLALSAERADQIAKQVLGIKLSQAEIDWLKGHPIYEYLFKKHMPPTSDFAISSDNPNLQLIRIKVDADKFYSLVNFTPYDVYFDYFLDARTRVRGCELKYGDAPIYRENGEPFRPILTSNVEEASILYQDDSGKLKLISCGAKEFPVKGDEVINLKPFSSHLQLLDVKYDAGWNNQLFLRGAPAPAFQTGELSWEQGIKGVCIAPDRWRFTFLRPSFPCEYKVLVNDKDYEQGPNHVLDTRLTWQTVAPRFS